MDQKLASERTSGGRVLIVGVVFVSAVGVLFWQVAASTIPVIKINQLFADDYHDGPSRGAKVQVDNGEITSIESIAPLQFTVGVKHDPETRLMVNSTVTVPENFKVGVPVSLRGTYDPNTKLFHAYRITTQCPSRYEATKEAYEAAGATRYEGVSGDSTAKPALEPVTVPATVPATRPAAKVDP